MRSLRLIGVAVALLAFAVGQAQAGLTRHDVLVIANSNSTVSQAVANYYQLKRGIPASHVKLVSCSTGDVMSPANFATLRDQIKAHLISLGADPTHPENDPIKAIVLTYDIPHSVSDGGEVYSAVDSALSATFTDSPWGKEPLGIYGWLQPTPGAPNAYYGDYASAMPFDAFRADAAASTYWEAFPEPGFTLVRMLDPYTALAAGGGGILYRGVLSGSSWTWTPVRGKDKACIGWRVSAISVRDATHAYACTGNSSRPHGGGTIITTSDGGQTWSRVRGTARGNAWKLVDSLHGIDYADPTHGWAVGTSQLAMQSAMPLMLRTTNGTSWTDISSKLPASFTPRAIAAADMNNIWICGSGSKIYRSTDAGETWALANTGAATADYTSIWIRLDGGTPKGWAAGTGGVIVRTENGSNWTQEAAGLTTSAITDLSAFDQDHACAAYNSTSFLTFTRGSGWRTESTGLAPMVSAASPSGSAFVSVGSTRYVFSKSASAWECSYTGTDTPWRLRYLVTRLDGYSFDTSPVDGIPDSIKNMIDRAAAATAPGEFVIDERTLTDGGQSVTPNYFTDTYNALLPIVGSTQITYDQTSTYLTGQSNVIAYTGHGMHDGYCNVPTTWGRTLHNWANGGIATVVESADGRCFDRPKFCWTLYAGGTVNAGKVSVYGFPSAGTYTGYRAALCTPAGQELASATIVSGTAQIDLSTIAWPTDHKTYVAIKFPASDPQTPNAIVYDDYYPSLAGNTTIYDSRATGIALTSSNARSLMAATLYEGASGGIASVDEPWSSYVGQPQYLFPRYAQGYTWGETAYMGLPGLGWQEVALGDPLMAPYATPPLVTITSPSQNGLLKTGTVNIAATVAPTGGSTIQKVEFWLDDDTLLTTLTSEPYQYNLDTVARGLADGAHRVEVLAYESGSVQNTGSATCAFVLNNTHTDYPSPVEVVKLDNNSKVALQYQIVTAPFGGFFYIEDANRRRGIRIVSSASVYDGDIVTVVGTLRTNANGEREMLADGVWVGN